MEWYWITLLCVGGGALLTVPVLAYGVLWARISATEDRLREVAERAPPARIESVEGVVEALRGRIDDATMDLSRYKDMVKGEVQRLAVVVRRMKDDTASPRSDNRPEEDEDHSPDEIDPKALGITSQGHSPSRRELREQARARGMRI